MTAVTIDESRAADPGLRRLVPARTVGPAVADQPPLVPAGTVCPVLAAAGPGRTAAAEVWSGWGY